MKDRPPRILETHRRFVRTTRDNPAISFGTTMAAGFAFFAWGGWKLDQHWGSEPLCLLLGVGLAFGFSGYELWKLLRTPQAPPPDKNEAPGRPGDDAP